MAIHAFDLNSYYIVLLTAAYELEVNIDLVFAPL